MTINDFDDYAAFVAVPRSDDEWYDLALESAAGRLGGFSRDDWQALRLHCGSADPRWRRRCAESLGGGDPAHAVPLLLALAAGDHDAVAEAAAFTLGSLPAAQLRGVLASADPAAILDALRRRTLRPAVVEAIGVFLGRWRAGQG
jgi:hypothetical protein